MSILPEVRFFLPTDAGNCAVQRRIFRNKRVCLPKNSCSWVASSPSQSSRFARCQLPQSGSPWQSTQTSSLCQGLSLWERWICVAKTERASPLKSKSSRLRADSQKAPRTSGGNAGRFGDTGCMPYASGWGCAAEDWAAMNSAASSGMSSKSSSLPMSTLSGGFLNRISYRIGTIYRVIKVA